MVEHPPHPAHHHHHAFLLPYLHQSAAPCVRNHQSPPLIFLLFISADLTSAALFPVHPLLLSPTSLRTLLIRLHLHSPTHSLPSSFQYFSYALWTVLPSSFNFNCPLHMLRSSTRSSPTLLSLSHSLISHSTGRARLKCVQPSILELPKTRASLLKSSQISTWDASSARLLSRWFNTCAQKWQCFDCSGLSPPPTCCWSTGLLVVSSRRRHFRSPGLDLWTDRSYGKAVCSPDALSLFRAQQTSCTYQLLHLNLWRTSMCKYFPMSTFISNFQNICDNLASFLTTFIFQVFLYQLRQLQV